MHPEKKQNPNLFECQFPGDYPSSVETGHLNARLFNDIINRLEQQNFTSMGSHLKWGEYVGDTV